MAENGNRGPNDFRARNGRRRREPPIIDASATEVPLDSDEPATAEAADAASLPAAEPEAHDAEAPVVPEIAEPVLFGSAMRDAAVKAEGGDTPAVPADGAVEAAGSSAAEESAPVSAAPELDPVPRSDVDPVAASAAEPVAERPSSAPPPGMAPSAFAASPAARAGGNGVAPWLLGLCSLVLLGALAWVLYTAPQRSGRDEIAELRSKVAALEARPDPAQVQVSVAALDKRLGAADADRAGLAKTVSDLNTRFDAVAQQAQAAQQTAQTAEADNAKPAAPQPAPAEPAPAPSGAAVAATVGALGALAAKVDGLDGRVATLATAQDETAKAVAEAPKPVAPDFGPADAKIAALDGRIGGLDGRIAALDGKVNGSDARLNGFDAKVNAVDAKINGFDARMNAFENRTNGLESKLDGSANDLAKLQATIGAKADAAAADLGRLQATLTSRIDGNADDLGKLQATVAHLPRVDLAPLQAASAALDGRVAAIEGELAAPKDGARTTEARAVGSADETRAAPIALVGQAVQRAVADGRPYASDLDALKALGAEPDALAELSPLAAKGAPTTAALLNRWESVQGDVLAALKPAEPGNAFDRFTASARNLVQVHRVGAVQGDDPSALVSQVDAALVSGDVPGALAAWTRLPTAGQDRSQDWAAAARARVDAAGAAQGLVSRAIATLGKTKS